MLRECIDGLNIKADGVYVDGTAGGAGHTLEIAKQVKSGRVVAIDQDPTAIAVIKDRLSEYDSVTVCQGNFRDIDKILQDVNITSVDGVLLDLGVSSHQLDEGERGFSYHQDALLDMRMSQSGFSAYDLVNTYSEQDLVTILFEYGEEKFARRIARNIVADRAQSPIRTTGELVEIIKKSMPAAAKRDKHPGKKTFQAIRIAVNAELDTLKSGIDKAFSILNPGGRLAIITFHSLEDRIVKQRFAGFCVSCTCPKEFPICICNNKAKGRLINRKPIIPSQDELEENNRSRTAKLRIIEKI